MTQIKLRRDTTANWATANSVLAQGEPAIDTTNISMKIGDGSTAWTDLQYIVPPKPPTPAIEYTGVFNGLPYYWKYTTNPPALQYSSNGSFAVVGGNNLYWLDQNFDDGNYDLSGLTSIRFTNIGGIKGYFDFSAKSEVVMTTLDMGEIAVIDEWFNFAGFSNTLTTFAANNLVDVGQGFTIYGNNFYNGPAMVFPALNRVSGDLYVDWNWNNMANTAAPSFPVLVHATSLRLYNNRYTTWSDFPLFHETNDLYFYQNTNNEALPFAGPGFPALTTIRYSLSYYQNQYMTSVPAFTNLTRIGGGMYFYGNGELQSFPSFPALTYCAGIYSSDCGSMTTLDSGSFMPSLLWVDGDVNFQNCSLNEASVDAILVKLASLDGTNGTTTYQYRNITINGGSNAIPSQTGLDAITTLQNRGCNVSYNS